MADASVTQNIQQLLTTYRTAVKKADSLDRIERLIVIRYLAGVSRSLAANLESRYGRSADLLELQSFATSVAHIDVLDTVIRRAKVVVSAFGITAVGAILFVVNTLPKVFGFGQRELTSVSPLITPQLAFVILLALTVWAVVTAFNDAGDVGAQADRLLARDVYPVEDAAYDLLGGRRPLLNRSVDVKIAARLGSVVLFTLMYVCAGMILWFLYGKWFAKWFFGS